MDRSSLGTVKLNYRAGDAGHSILPRIRKATSIPGDQRHRFPPAIIAHAVWVYFRFALSDGDVEESLAERGIVLTHETVRRWCQEVGRADANGLRRRRPRPSDTWHLDEVFIQIDGVQHDLRRAVDREGNALDLLVQRRRDTATAKTSFRRLL